MYVNKAKFIRIVAFANKTRNSIVIIQFNISFNEMLHADNQQAIGECCVITSGFLILCGVMVQLIKCLKVKFIQAELR